MKDTTTIPGSVNAETIRVVDVVQVSCGATSMRLETRTVEAVHRTLTGPTFVRFAATDALPSRTLNIPRGKRIGLPLLRRDTGEGGR